MTEAGMSEPAVVTDVACLGCGCLCDDVRVHVRDGRIADAEGACALGRRWFGDGAAPARALARGREVPLEAALDEAAALLADAPHALVYLAPELSCEAQREAVALADALRASLDSVTSDTVGEAILAAQRRGRATATLGEIRNRADLLVFWGVDPQLRYPRYMSRYAPMPEGLFVPAGRRGRVVIAVDVGEARGPEDADLRVSLRADEELDALAALRADARGHAVAARGDLHERLAPLGAAARAARYAAIVHDAEPAEAGTDGRAEGLVALAQALNAHTRCALSTLRAGGNRSGADAVLTWQTGYPMAVDFARGWPRYRPQASAIQRLAADDVDAALVVGACDALPRAARSALATTSCVVVGPRASECASAAEVAVDTAVAGIHEGGTAARLDDVMLPLRPVVAGPPAAADVVAALRARVLALTSGSAP